MMESSVPEDAASTPPLAEEQKSKGETALGTEADGGEQGVTLYVGNIDASITDSEGLRSLFADFPGLISAKLVKNQLYGFVVFQTRAQAEEAVRGRNGLEGLKVHWSVGNVGDASKASEQRAQTHIFVGDLPGELTDDAQLYNCFAKFPTCVDARIMWDTQTGRSKGYGFVSFMSEEGAQEAIDAMNGVMLLGRRIRCGQAQHKLDLDSGPLELDEVDRQDPTNCNVYVGNLAEQLTQEELAAAFTQFGEVAEVRVHRKGGFGFVRFATHASAVAAIVGMHGKELGGRPLKCSWGKASPAPTQTPPQGSSGAGYSGSGGAAPGGLAVSTGTSIASLASLGSPHAHPSPQTVLGGSMVRAGSLGQPVGATSASGLPYLAGPPAIGTFIQQAAPGSSGSFMIPAHPLGTYVPAGTPFVTQPVDGSGGYVTHWAGGASISGASATIMSPAGPPARTSSMSSMTSSVAANRLVGGSPEDSSTMLPALSSSQLLNDPFSRRSAPPAMGYVPHEFQPMPSPLSPHHPGQSNRPNSHMLGQQQQQYQSGQGQYQMITGVGSGRYTASGRLSQADSIVGSMAGMRIGGASGSALQHAASMTSTSVGGHSSGSNSIGPSGSSPPGSQSHFPNALGSSGQQQHLSRKGPSGRTSVETGMHSHGGPAAGSLGAAPASPHRGVGSSRVGQQTRGGSRSGAAPPGVGGLSAPGGAASGLTGAGSSGGAEPPAGITYTPMYSLGAAGTPGIAAVPMQPPPGVMLIPAAPGTAYTFVPAPGAVALAAPAYIIPGQQQAFPGYGVQGYTAYGPQQPAVIYAPTHHPAHAGIAQPQQQQQLQQQPAGQQGRPRQQMAALSPQLQAVQQLAARDGKGGSSPALT